jgi:hypothetical protein
MKMQNFQGTSKEGDFQSALLEAANKALEALSIGTSDQRIAWKLIEISGSKGGFLGENTITVTIEAQSNSTAMQNLREAVTSIAQSSNKEKVIVEEFQIVGFDTQSAVAFLVAPSGIVDC